MVKKKRVAKLKSRSKKHVGLRKVKVRGCELANHFDSTLTLRQNYDNLKMINNVNQWASEQVPTEETLATPVITPMGNAAVVVDEVSLADLQKLQTKDENKPKRDAIGKSRAGKKSILAPGEKLKVAPGKKPHEKKMSDGQIILAQKLIKKHKDNYEAMARDFDLNTYQDTAAKLRKLCAEYLKSQESPAESN